MKPRTAMILSSILVVCIAYMALRNVDWFKPDSDPDGGKVFEPTVTQCMSIVVVDADKKELAFVRRDKDWYLDKPIRARAQQWQVDNLAGSLKDLTGREVQDIGDDLTGLDRPLWKITFTDDQGKTHELHVGRQAPMIGARDARTYVRAGEGPVLSVAVDFADALRKPAHAFRDKTILQLDTGSIVRITVAGRENYELARQEGAWAFVAPFSVPADRAAVDRLLRRACTLVADDIVAGDTGDLAAYGLKAGSESLRLTLWQRADPPTARTSPADTQPAEQKPKPYVIAFGTRSKDKVYARRADTDDVFVLSASSVDNLQPKPVTLRKRELFDFRADDVDEVVLDVPKAPATLKRRGRQWHMDKPYAGPGNDTAVRKLLTKVAGLKAEHFRDNVSSLAGYGLAPPRATITLGLKGKSRRPVLLIGSETPSKEMTFVKPGAAASVAVVKTADVKSLLAQAPAYWTTELLKIPPRAEVGRLVVQRGRKTFTVRRDEKDPAKWALLAPLRVDADTKSVKAIVDGLRAMKAEEIIFLGDKTPDKFTRAKEIIVAAVTATETTQAPPQTRPASGPKPADRKVTRTYVVNVVRIDGKVYAMRPGEKIAAIGLCGGKLYQTLSAELRGRTTWTIDTDTLREVRLVAGKEVLHLRRDGDKWVYPKDPFVKIDPAAVSRYLDRIKTGKAQSFADYKTRNLHKYRLNKPWYVLELTDRDGNVRKITVSHTGEKDKANRYAVADGTDGVFTLSVSDAGEMVKRLDDFKKK